MTSNLPTNQKTDWLSNEIVMPTHTNGWGNAINKLKNAIPIYANCGNYYKATYTNNIYQLTPLTLSDNTTNETVTEYIEGMSVVFQCPADNLADCSININSLGIKSIKSVYNTTIEAGILKQGAFVKLTFDKTNNYFKFEQDLSKADINLSNINNSGKSVIDTRIDNKIQSMLELLYPVGSIYISTTAQCPLEALGIGTWASKGSGRVLQGSDSNHNAGTTIGASLPTLTSDSQGSHYHNRGTMNIKGSLAVDDIQPSSWVTGAFTVSDSVGNKGPNGEGEGRKATFNAANSGAWTGVTNTVPNHTHSVTWTGHVGTTVQPNAYVVNIWERVE